MHVDYIIVGCGLAGIHFCEQLVANNKTFIVYDNHSQQSSTVAGGLYNPVVLKRFTSIWKGKEQLEFALPIYHRLEKELNIIVDYKIPVLRRFTSNEEQNDWFIASDKPLLKEYLSDKIITNNNALIDAPFGFGKVLQTGRIEVKVLINAYIKRLKIKECFFEDIFVYDALKISKNQIQYNSVSAKYIVFAEGYGLKKNPYFNYLPLDGVKGELITIHAPDLKIDYILKSSVFIFPHGNDLYSVGATYEWKDKTNTITKKGREELLDKLKTFVKCPFEVINQVAGIRPTVLDRRPLVGQHHLHKNMFVLNGLGTRGVIIGPYVAKKLFGCIENGEDLEKEININRFN